MSLQERRRFIRIPPYLTASIRHPQTGKMRRALVKNVGGNGIGVVTEELFDPGTSLEVELRLPDVTEPIAFLGEIVWSKPVGGPQQQYHNPTAEMGIKFLRIDPHALTMIAQYAASHPASGAGS